MPKYRVELTRTEYKTVEIIVEAKDENDAQDTALIEVSDDDWELARAYNQVEFMSIVEEDEE